MTGDSVASGSLEPELLVETDPALPLVYVSANLYSGASEEPEGKEGLTRLLARLMRRTAGGLSAEEMDERVDSMGAAMGAEVGLSSVGISGSVIARSLDEFAELLRDVIARPSMEEDEFERLKRETRAEILEFRDNDRALGRYWFRRKLFTDHVYGRPLIGTPQSLDRITRSDVLAAYDQHVFADNLIFSFAGDIGQERAQHAAGLVSSSLRRAPRRADATPDPVPPQGRRLFIVDKPERTQTQIFIGGLGTHPHDLDHDALVVANTVFGGTFTARLSQEVRAKRGWSYGAYSSLYYDRRRQAFNMWTFPKASDAADCIKLQLEMLSDWCENGVTEEELQRAKRYLIRSNAFNIDTPAKRLGQRLEERLYGLPEGYHAEFTQRIESVTLEQANRAVNERISARDLIVIVVGTERQLGPSLQQAIDDLVHTEVQPFDQD